MKRQPVVSSNIRSIGLEDGVMEIEFSNGVSANATRDQVEDAYRRLAMKHHPDRGGSQSEMARVNAARDEGLRSAIA